MKCFYYCRILPARSIFTLLLSFSFSHLLAQIMPSGIGRFGIDGDVAAQEKLSGSFDPAQTHDWFNVNDVNRLCVFDTVGTAAQQQLVAAGRNVAFTKKMQYPSYSVEDGILMLGGTYARDYFGLDVSSNGSDKTVFVPSVLNNKSYASPLSWTTVPTGSDVPSKTDIIDTYIHLRRNGSSLSDHLLMYVAASTLSTGGDHHLDFELYKSNIAYNSTTGLFTSDGPVSTGGRNAWEFNDDGSVKTFGELTLSFSFNNTQVSDIAIYIWVPYQSYATANPKEFDFVTGEWNGASKFGGYGYARIKPNDGAFLPAWGTVNNSNTPGPVWGTNAREAGTMATNYYSNVYSQGQFAEAAIDLTSLGIDPAFASGDSKCRSPYVKVMVKSRSSSSFSSALQDFVAPYELFDEPVIPAAIVEPGLLSCYQPTRVLAPKQMVSGAVYRWSTADGNILSGQNTAQALVDKGGRYTLTVSVYEGCAETVQQVVVPADTTKPVATAGYTGLLAGDEKSAVTLKGGDAEKSNYETPFGSSGGLLWQWSGPDGYAAMVQNPEASAEGTYHLTVTETRNGCTAVDSVTVSRVEQVVLPVMLEHFSGRVASGKVQLTWRVSGKDGVERFEIERAVKGGNEAAGLVWATEQPGTAGYAFQEPVPLSGAAYRLKVVAKHGQVHYSSWVYLDQKPGVLQAELKVINPVMGDLHARYTTPNEGNVTVNVYSVAGQLVYTRKHPCHKGENGFIIPGAQISIKGHLTVEVVTGNGYRNITQVIWP